MPDIAAGVWDWTSSALAAVTWSDIILAGGILPVDILLTGVALVSPLTASNFAMRDFVLFFTYIISTGMAVSRPGPNNSHDESKVVP